MTAKTSMDRKASGVSFGIFLICIGVLLFTKWWWPGIIMALSLPAGAEMIFRGKTGSGIGVIVVFAALAAGVALIRAYGHLRQGDRRHGTHHAWRHHAREGLLWRQ
ncbi:MAG: hypothetical protein WBB65_02740 [Anaerolineales bacterium]